MDKKNKYALRKIMHNLKQGRNYGYFMFWNYYHDCPMRFPMFMWNLGYDKYAHVIRWRNAGSSANKATLKDLEWIITVIFETTPIQFLHDYILDCSMYIRDCV